MSPEPQKKKTQVRLDHSPAPTLHTKKLNNSCMTIWKESEIAQLTHNWRKYTSADSHRSVNKALCRNRKALCKIRKALCRKNKAP